MKIGDEIIWCYNYEEGPICKGTVTRVSGKDVVYVDGHHRPEDCVYQHFCWPAAAEEELKAIFSGDIPWVTIVWDDPVNLMTYVTYVLMELFGFSKEKAHELMMKVHTEGKAVVSTGSREEMEHDVARLHEYGLWATLQRGDQAL